MVYVETGHTWRESGAGGRARAQRRRKRRKRRMLRGLTAFALRVLALAAGTSFLVGIGSAAQVIFASGRENAGAQSQARGPVTVMKTEVSYPSPTPVPGQDSGFLMLVNKEHPLPSGYEVKLKQLNSGRGWVAKDIYGDLSAMLTDGSREGNTFCVASAYRSGDRQRELLDEDVEALMKKGLDYEEAYARVTRKTMPPGFSEHETGLAVDLVAADYQMLDGGQEETEENKWLRENCHRYGFILRYPQGGEDVTGVDYESWHFRYVGREAAAYITDNGLTLEEYLEKIENNRVVKQVSRAVW